MTHYKLNDQALIPSKCRDFFSLLSYWSQGWFPWG